MLVDPLWEPLAALRSHIAYFRAAGALIAPCLIVSLRPLYGKLLPCKIKVGARNAGVRWEMATMVRLKKGETTKYDVASVLFRHPHWSTRQIADHLGCSVQYVNTTAYRNKLKIKRRTKKFPAPRKVIEELGVAAFSAGLTVEVIKAFRKRRNKDHLSNVSRSK